MRRALAPAVLLSLLSAGPALASHPAPAYVELRDAPTITVDWSKANTQAVTLHGNRRLDFENGQKGGKYTLILKQDETGSRTVTWPPVVHWPGESRLPPVLTTTANRKDYLTFVFDGVSYDGVGFAQGF